MKTELTAARAFLEALLAKLGNDSLTPVDSSMAKLWLSELEFKVADQCLQFFGGMGYAHETPISQIWSHARAHRILLGTSEIHRLAIGRSL
jgi:acyl-CoA dehydrogenase